MKCLSLLPAIFSILFAAHAFADEAPPKADFVYVDRGEVTSLDLNRMSWMQDIRIAMGCGKVFTRSTR